MREPSLLSRIMQEFERAYLRRELERYRWNRKRTAVELGISYRGLMYKLRKLGIRRNPSVAA